ncbi:hypothetical protein EQM14_00100 [Caproiciproducens sp. NJN-50]|uniref:DUF6323 family protein n=1 Tax=Acutalibacteraceae TaxID=3082771 RepID=UPI000FFE2E67|nr:MULTISPECIES: DUF6323 family protein [Acutalibacteraceae]QAT48302.1 hypothetical protein EQM14_00100 [Caproiciproducens sp. NJN-50]
MEFQLSSFLRPSALDDARTAENLLTLNEETQEFGLELSREDALALAETRRIALQASGRVEFGTPVLEKIIRAFSRSRYLYQYDYAPALHELLEAFFLLKNETEDRFSDDNLVDFLFDCFESRYRGSLEMFQGPELEQLRRLLLFGAEEEKDDWDGEDKDE